MIPKPSDIAGSVLPRGTRAAGGAAGEPQDDAVETAPLVLKAPRFPRYRTIAGRAPVVAYTGANGVGKTLLAVSDCLLDLRAGRPVFSTVAIESPWGHSDPILSLRQLLEIRDATVLIDEVSVVLSSRMTGSLPDDVSTFLQTMRHQGVTLRWTAPAWARAEIQLREVTQVCVGAFALGKRRPKGKFWPRPVMIGAAAFDMTAIKLDATPEKAMRGSRRVYRPAHLPGWGAYDSEADASRIGWNRQQRVCLDCGGTRTPEKCSPERHHSLGIPAVRS